MQPLDFFLQEQCHLTTDARIAVGVSGGSDSMCLLSLLHQGGYKLLALHLDHGIRDEFATDAEFVQQSCQEWGIPCKILRVDVPTLAAQSRQSIEESARNARYKFLFEAASDWNADAVAVAHHANDQAETVLMHFIRGAGLDGLRGMQTVNINPEYHPSIPLIRPLLYIWKDEIIAYCKQNQIGYLEDATNLESSYYRNWLRNNLIPQIETKNPEFQNGLVRMSIVTSGQRQILMEAVDKAFFEIISSQGTGWLGLNVESYMRFTQPMQREILRKAIHSLSPSIRDLDFFTIDRIGKWIHSAADSDAMEIIEGLTIQLRKDVFYLCLPRFTPPVIGYPQMDKDQIPLSIPGKTRLNAEWVVLAEQTKLTPSLFDYIKLTGKGEAFLDSDQIAGAILVRNRRPGDRIQLLGDDSRSQKLADVFINHKVPVYAREHYPVMETAGTILWIPAVQIADDFKVTRETKRLLHLQLISTSQTTL